jgi:type VI secretion system protein ImpL
MAFVWPLTAKQSQQSAQMDKAWRGLTEAENDSGFRPRSIYGRSATMAVIRPNAPQAVGCLLAEHCTAEHLASMLEAQTRN